MTDRPPPPASDLLVGIALGAALAGDATSKDRQRSIPFDVCATAAERDAWRILASPAAKTGKLPAEVVGRLRAALGVAGTDGRTVLEAVWNRLEEIAARRQAYEAATKIRVLAGIEDKAALLAAAKRMVADLEGK